MTIDLTSPFKLPTSFVKRLKSINGLCEEYEFSEELVEHHRVVEIVSDINKFCESNRILGFHYTRAFPRSIIDKGLLVRTGDDIREQFLSNHSSHFSEDERNELLLRWSNYYSPSQKKARDKKIYFNFTLSALENGGAEYLKGMFGGEQVIMSFDFDCAIGQKLASIGEPLVVHCSLDPHNVETYISNPWGKIAVSSYHGLINPEACTIDQDGSQQVPVLPKHIEKTQSLPIPARHYKRS